MSNLILPANFTPRRYQKGVMRYLDRCVKYAVPGRAWWCVHRRGGKDRTLLAQASKMSMQRIGTYWHMLPTLKQARSAVWDNITNDGKKLIDATFPRECIESINQAEMKIELKWGSIIQLKGSDNFDSKVCANPVNATMIDYALCHPRGWDLIRPILTENNGTAAFISTPRGYNDFHALGQVAKKEWDANGIKGRWYYGLMDINYTMSRGGLITPQMVEQELRDGMPPELARQEYYCDFAAANVGAILGRWIEQAERDGRIDEWEIDAEGSGLELSCDIGFRDTASFWLWQRLPGGWFLCCGYDEATGCDVDDWIQRFEKNGWTRDRISKLWMPHDARAKTFTTKTSAMERFQGAGYQVGIVPQLSVADRISAARKVARRTMFVRSACELGLKGLRAWQFKYNEETKQFSKEPEHDWASHPGDGWSYGAVVMNPREMPAPAPAPAPPKPQSHDQAYTLDDLWELHET